MWRQGLLAQISASAGFLVLSIRRQTQTQRKTLDCVRLRYAGPGTEAVLRLFQIENKTDYASIENRPESTFLKYLLHSCREFAERPHSRDPHSLAISAKGGAVGKSDNNRA